MAQNKKPHTLRHCMVVFAPYPFLETRVQREAEALEAHGHEVDVICPRYGGEPLIDQHHGVGIHRVNLRWYRQENLFGKFSQYLFFFLFAAMKLNGLHFRRRYDVVQVHNLPDFLVFAALLPKAMGAKIILDLHDLMPEFYQGRYQQSLKPAVLKLILWQEKLSCLFADHVITVTEHWRQTLIKRGVPPRKCSVVLNLADPRIFFPLPLEDMGLKTNDRFRLFYHGEMPERYGLDLVLKAVDMLRDKIPEIHFTLVGKGPFLDSLKSMANNLALDEKLVEFLPPVPAEDLPPLIAQADVGVVPYRNDVFTDSLLPTKLLEYAVMGLPTIAAKTTVISDYFDGDMVEFFQPGDVDDLARCILELYNNRNRRDELSLGIQRFNERYNWPRAGLDYVNTVRRLCHRQTEEI